MVLYKQKKKENINSRRIIKMVGYSPSLIKISLNTIARFSLDAVASIFK
jgi:hypothetical protein